MATYSLIRAGILVLFIALFMILKRLRTPKDKIKRVLFIVGGGFLLGLLFLPFENLMLRFESPDAAFSYTRADKIIDIYNIKDYAAVVYRKNDGSWGDVVLKKDEKGWLIDNPSFMDISHIIKVEQYLIDYRFITETIMFVSLNKIAPNETMKVQSEDGKEFRVFSLGDKSFQYKIYYGFVPFNNGSAITVDGKKIQLN